MPSDVVLETSWHKRGNTLSGQRGSRHMAGIGVSMSGHRVNMLSQKISSRQVNQHRKGCMWASA